MKKRANIAMLLLSITGAFLIFGLPMFMFLSIETASSIYFLLMVLFSIAVLLSAIQIKVPILAKNIIEDDVKKCKKLLTKFCWLTVMPLTCAGIYICTCVLTMMVMK